MLLERIVPGDSLRSLEDADEQLRIGTEVMAALPVRPAGVHGFPRYQDWIAAAFSRMHRDYSPDATTETLMASAQELYTEIGAASQTPVLLHGDLHHDNILRSGDGRWKVIDPQGVIGAPFLECGRFLENHVLPDVNEPDLDGVARAVEFVADRLRESPHRIATALFILHLLATCWSYEMNEEAETLRLQTRQCAALLDLVRRI
jgi:streptomycin 6-kinase